MFSAVIIGPLPAQADNDCLSQLIINIRLLIKYNIPKIMLLLYCEAVDYDIRTI